MGKRTLLCTVVFCLPAIQADAAESLQALMEYAKQPIVVQREVQQTKTVYREVKETVRCVERYGLFKRKCRIVYRTITRQVPETRVTTSMVAQSRTTVASRSSSATSNKVIRLDAPLSAGAIAAKVIERFNLKFPAEQFPVIPDQDEEFPVNINSSEPAEDSIEYQFVIDPQSDPRFVDILVIADDPSGQAKAAADRRLAEAEQALIEKQ